MKGKSSRHQSSDHQNDDWVDGSWTVDCICGVNFDDGEEMVDCDECGVWVHTRCSGYNKGDKMFMCDNCKGGYNNNVGRSGGENGDKNNEETEVAQLLVDLPNKTVRIGRRGSGSSSVVGDDGAGSTRRPYKLWTDIPMEERVHVQGVPGGDPGLFSGLSKVFSPQLWKSTGYVPKKFNFQYKEFPCWDDDEDDDDEVEVGGNESRDDKGAGVLFSLAKENVLPSSPGVEVVGMGVGVEGRVSSKKASSKEMKKLNLEDSDVRKSQNVKRERTLLRPHVIRSSNKKKEDLGGKKDCGGRENAPAADKEADIKKSGAQSSLKAIAPCSEAKQVEFCEDRGTRTFTPCTQSVKNLKSRDNGTRETIKTLAMDKMDEKIKNSSAVNKHCPNGLSFDKSRNCLGDAVSKGSAGNQATTLGSSVGNGQSVMEGHKKAVDNMGRIEDFTNNPEKISEGGLASTASEVECSKAIQDVDNDSMAGSAGACIRVKTELDHRSGAVLDIQSSTPTEAKHGVITSDRMSEYHKVNDIYASCSQSSNPKPIKVGRTAEETTNSHIDTHCVSTINTHQVKQDIDGSDCPVVGQKVALEATNRFGNSSALPTQQKPLPPVAKSSSSSSTNVISRSSTSDISKPADIQIPSPITMEQVTSKFNARNKKTSPKDLVRCEEMHDVSRKVANSSGNSTVKVKYTSKISQTYVSKRNISATKDSAIHSSGKASRHNAAVTSGSSDSARSPKNQDETNLDGKTSSSVSLQRGEKINQSNTQPTSNLNQALTRPLPHTPAALSDEELALLLHHELNSSPRVSRGPRVRHAGSLPHLASSASKSMLIKRSSSSGGKDNNAFSRRRNKYVKDGSHSRDLDDEVKRAERLIPPSPDQRRQGKELLTKRNDNGSSTVAHTRKKIPASSNPANSGPSSSEANDHNSPRRTIDDDSGTVTVPVYRTLPRLISEIMGKGKRMTYEELCNAVLPHWDSLRKHNGDRYAYSSHSQAVLDCLRNRHEWAQLVDRGPKTTSSKKRRMLDTEESDDDEYMKDITVKESDGRSFESQREDYSKGKRKARRRRRLALQGRGIRDVRKRQKTEMLSDDDDDSLPGSSEDSMFNEYDSRGSGGVRPVLSEASASSD